MFHMKEHHLNYTIIEFKFTVVRRIVPESSELQALQANTKIPECKPGRREVDALGMVVAA